MFSRITVSKPAWPMLRDITVLIVYWLIEYILYQIETNETQPTADNWGHNPANPNASKNPPLYSTPAFDQRDT